jgi:hypothetical protein
MDSLNATAQKTQVLLKDVLFHRGKVEGIASELQEVYSFAKDEFVDAVVAGFATRELKARITWIAECLQQHLPKDYRSAVGILLRSLPAANNPNLSIISR